MFFSYEMKAFGQRTWVTPLDQKSLLINTICLILILILIFNEMVRELTIQFHRCLVDQSRRVAELFINFNSTTFNWTKTMYIQI